jgi:hypothetical protein
MGLNDVTMLAFTACNSFRMIAYVGVPVDAVMGLHRG